MKNKIGLILMLSVVLSSCGNSQSSMDDLHLNDGEKWVVVEHMMTHIRNMETDIHQFDGKALEAYTNLGSDLKSNIDLLTSNCTMEGQAHDELHNWLVPYIGQANKLAKSKDLEEAIERYALIKKSFGTFNIYFQ